ncbi:MAG: SDR family oxidoreductase [Planctomycetota bacterium]|nr:SDR family oxidoreductase [Planctomycetota bacterium]
MSNKLEGKVALVTGGTSGIGLATARRFAMEGAYVFITGRRKEVLDAAVAHLGVNAFGIPSDVSDSADLDRLFATIRREKGRIDVLFANAGGGEFLPLDQITEAHFDKWFGINVKGTLFTVQGALPLMPDGSSVILSASVVATKGLENFSVYSATKAAVRSFARTWTVDLKSRRIRVNAISPGPIATPAIDALAGGREEGERFRTGMAAGVPMGRVGDPDEIAKAAVFLASDDSSFVTGIELFVDGGMAQV